MSRFLTLFFALSLFAGHLADAAPGIGRRAFLGGLAVAAMTRTLPDLTAREREVEVSPNRKRLVERALGEEGDKYRKGCVGPSCYDCSGFVFAMISAEVGPQHAKSITRLTAAGYAGLLKNYKYQSPQYALPGDLIYFKPHGGYPAHIGLVTDPVNKKFITAQSSRTGVLEVSYAKGDWFGDRPYSIYKNIWID